MDDGENGEDREDGEVRVGGTEVEGGCDGS